MESLGETFASVPDPRAGNARHDLAEILVIAFAATLCGAETCCDMALFGRAKEPLLREFLALPHGIPSHDTFSRVFRLIDPAYVSGCEGRLKKRTLHSMDHVLMSGGLYEHSYGSNLP